MAKHFYNRLSKNTANTPCIGLRMAGISMFSKRFLQHTTRALAVTALTTVMGTSFIIGSAHNVVAQERPAVSSAIQIKAGKGKFVRLNADAGAVFVADPDIADVDIKFANMLYVYGTKPGETTVHVVDSDGNILLSRSVIVVANVQELQSSLMTLMPGTEITVHPSNEKLVLKGLVSSVEQADQAIKIARGFVEEDQDIINMISIDESAQVTLKVKVAEVSRDVTESFGIEWQTGSFFEDQFRFGSFTQNGIINLEEDGTTIFNPGGPNTIDIPGDAFSNLIGFADGSFSLDMLISALESKGIVSVLAQPNLTAISGETASFLAGGEFPILIPAGIGNQVAVEFKEFGVALNFTPFVLPGNRIRMKVNPSVSELSEEGAVELAGFRVPSLRTRKAETTVELGSGDSFTIGGLLQNNIQDQISEYPWLSDIPVLGALFRSTSYQRKDSELLIVATPYIVEPVKDPNAIRLPTDDVKVPNLRNRVLYGSDTSTSIVPREATTNSLAGPTGFFNE